MEELNNNTLNQFENTNFIDVFDDNESTLVDNSDILGVGELACGLVPLGNTGVLGAISTDRPLCLKDGPCSSDCKSDCTSNCTSDCSDGFCTRDLVLDCPTDCAFDCRFDCTFDCTSDNIVTTYYYAIGIYLCLSGYTNNTSSPHLISSSSVSCKITGGTLGAQTIAATLFPTGTGTTYNFTKNSNGNYYYVKTGTTTTPSQITITSSNGSTAYTANISLTTAGYSTVNKSASCFFYGGTSTGWILPNTILASCPRNSVLTQMNHMLIRSTGTTVPSPCRWKITSHTGAVLYAHTFNYGSGGANVISGITIYSSSTTASFMVQGVGVEGDSSGAWKTGLAPTSRISFINGNTYPIDAKFAPAPNAPVIATTDLLNNIYPNYKKYTSIFPTANYLALSTGRGIATSEFSFSANPSNADQLIPLNNFLRPATSAIFTNLISGSTKFTHHIVI